MVEPPVPGYNVVTTLDLRLQEMAEKALAARAKRGAIVIIDPNDGDLLALASWPTFDPNEFVPSISSAQFKKLQDEPGIPLLPRAFRSAYPPGSTFKITVGLAAFETNTITPHDQYECVPAMDIGNTTFHNWKHSDRGSLNFVQALTESCDTWFYQVGIATGAAPILDWATKLGFGTKCGIPLKGEVDGRLPNDAYMKATHGRKILNGDIANLSIGQGDLLVTPLQMAQAMAIVANGGTFYQTRLVQQVQTVGNEIVAAYSVRAKKTINASSLAMEQIHTAMVDAVNAPAGTAHQASLDKISVAGKTGTAQWGPKEKERTAAWFAGFVPADHPQYAFAALYEGDVGSTIHGGSAAAPMIGRILRQVYGEKGDEEKPEKAESEEDSSD
jgi:penicillin-binding protein 2